MLKITLGHLLPVQSSFCHTLGKLVSLDCGQSLIQRLSWIPSWLWSLVGKGWALNKMSAKGQWKWPTEQQLGPGYFPWAESSQPVSVNQRWSEPVSSYIIKCPDVCVTKSTHYEQDIFPTTSCICSSEWIKSSGDSGHNNANLYVIQSNLSPHFILLELFPRRKLRSGWCNDLVQNTVTN